MTVDGKRSRGSAMGMCAAIGFISRFAVAGMERSAADLLCALGTASLCGIVAIGAFVNSFREHREGKYELGEEHMTTALIVAGYSLSIAIATFLFCL